MSIWDDVRRSTDGGIPYKAVAGPEIEHDENVTAATETYLIRGSNLAAFFAESMPPPYAFGGYVILPPRRRMPGCGWFVTKKLSARPHNDSRPGDPFLYDTGAADDTYEPDYLVTINYEVNRESDTERNSQQPETFLEHSLQAGGEFYSIGKDRLRYSEDGDEGSVEGEDEVVNLVVDGGRQIVDTNMPGAHLTVATLEHTLKWPYALAPNWVTFFDCLGKINDSQTVLFNNAPEYTVLFSSISGSQKYVWNGASASVQPWTLEFKFSQRVAKDDDGNPITWNMVFHPNARWGAKWVTPFWLTDPTDGNTKRFLYESADLYSMFKTNSL